MRTILVTVSDDRMGRKEGLYGKTQKKIESIFKNNLDFGISEFLTLTFPDIEQTEFYEQNKTLLLNIDPAKNGRVYKPFAIQQGLERINDEDFLIYTDASPEMWPFDTDYPISGWYNLEVIKNLCISNNDILTAFVKWDTRKIGRGLGIHTHENFTLDRCMRFMGLGNFSKSYMGASGMVVIRKTKATVDFVKQWLYYNCIDVCCALGRKEDPNDYSFWSEEDGRKMGARSDQSILGLLLCCYGYKMVDTIPSEFNPYNFLNFCKPGHDYKFIDPTVLVEEEPRIKKGDIVINQAGQELIVFEIWPVDGEETLIVGKHKESCYRTKPDQVRLK